MSERHEQARIEVESHYVRKRHTMALFGSFGPLYVDYYLHLMQHGLRYEPDHDALLKDALAAVTLHLASRPNNEMAAWTVNVIGAPPVNLFATGDSERGNVCGRVFTTQVKRRDTSLFVTQVSRPRTPTRHSTVEVAGRDFLRMVEQFYDQSEQLPARCFRLEDERFAMLVAQPDVDLTWFEAVDTEGVRALEAREELRLLERRRYHFGCGCDLERIQGVIAPTARGHIDELFGDEPTIKVQCPRCAGVFLIEREDLEVYLREHP